MARLVQLSMLVLIGISMAGCTTFKILRQRSEYQGFLEDWGVGKPRKPWIYVPVLAVLMGCFGTGCNLMEGIHQFNPNYKRPVPFSSNWWELRKEKKER